MCTCNVVSHVHPHLPPPPSPLPPPPNLQAYFFEDDSDEHSGSDVSPLVRRPPSQSVNNSPHSHIFTGYLSAVEVLLLVSLA